MSWLLLSLLHFLSCFEGHSCRRAYHRLLDRKVSCRLSKPGWAEFPHLLPAATGWRRGAPCLPGTGARPQAVQIPFTGRKSQHLASMTLRGMDQGYLWGLLWGVQELSSYCYEDNLQTGFLTLIKTPPCMPARCIILVKSTYRGVVRCPCWN